ncbi:hypothetical protein Veis_0143 [Verminephrobacter eiseniae EF01-2]|uniref:Uncharacterized protein n=2 Tax=Verminephrobacter eiseniae TaxID=364317 RepID=A1WE78_VEREI|nr:hypothetical protein Veis_0143 [Verminephrobacter eiseniae EF01-2]
MRMARHRCYVFTYQTVFLPALSANATGVNTMQNARWKQRPAGSHRGGFGPDDQLGRMNLRTPEIRRQAFREVQQGLAFCLSLPLHHPGGNALLQHRKEPRFFHEKRNYDYRLSNLCACFDDAVSDDAVMLYTQYSTQWDGLGHVGQMFDADGRPEKVYDNGFRGGVDVLGPDDATPGPDGAATRFGARAIGIEHLAGAVGSPATPVATV